MPKKTAKIVLSCIKDPDGFGNLQHELGLSDDAVREHFTWGEYADIELEVAEDMTIVGGRFLKVKR